MTPPDLSQYRDAFVQEVKASLAKGRDAIARVRTSPPDRAALDDAKRFFHTLAGTSALMSFSAISSRCHALEQQCRGHQEDGGMPSTADCDAWTEELHAWEKELLTMDV
jgi:chemotaxis protein histidine kinase CheA